MRAAEGVNRTHRRRATVSTASLSHVAPLSLLLCLLGSLPSSIAEQVPIQEDSTQCIAGCRAPVEAVAASSLLQASKVMRDVQLPEHGQELAENRFNSYCTPEDVQMHTAPACDGQLLEERSFLSNTAWAKTAEAINSASLGGNKQPGGFHNGFVANVTWMHLSSAGATCVLKEAPTASTMRTSSQLVLDATELPTSSAPSSPRCAEAANGEGGNTDGLEAHFAKLKAAGKAGMEAFPFSYKFRGRTYNDGRLRMVWYKPGVECPPDGCQVVITLHGLNRVSQMGTDSREPLSGVERLALRPACEEDYQSLRSIILGPQFEPQAFPQAGPELVTENFADFRERAQTNFHYHTRELDVFGDGLVPVLKQWTSQHHQDVDMNRIHLVGFSMGAVGAMVGAFSHSDFFASVVAISPCINADTNFPEPVVEWLPQMTQELAARKKLNRITVFVGEDDKMYENTGANCVDAWSQLLGLAQERGLINAQQDDHVEIRMLIDEASRNLGEAAVPATRTHLDAFQYAWLELNYPLWEDKYC